MPLSSTLAVIQGQLCVRLCDGEGGYSPVRVRVWADACHFVPATNACWHVIYLELPLLLAVRGDDECFKSRRVSAKWLFYPPLQLKAVLLDWRFTIHSCGELFGRRSCNETRVSGECLVFNNKRFWSTRARNFSQNKNSAGNAQG